MKSVAPVVMQGKVKMANIDWFAVIPKLIAGKR